MCLQALRASKVNMPRLVPWARSVYPPHDQIRNAKATPADSFRFIVKAANLHAAIMGGAMVSNNFLSISSNDEDDESGDIKVLSTPNSFFLHNFWEKIGLGVLEIWWLFCAVFFLFEFDRDGKKKVWPWMTWMALVFFWYDMDFQKTDILYMYSPTLGSHWKAKDQDNRWRVNMWEIG